MENMEEKTEKIGKIRKKSEKIGKTQKKGKLNSEMM
jgi:hypothetical protein